MSWSETDARAHLLAVARKHKITVVWRARGWRHYEANVTTRLVFIGAPRTPRDYLAALHEMGHVASRHARGAMNRKAHLTEEGAAWDWAIAHASPEHLRQVTRRHAAEIGGAWASYIVTG